MKIQIVLLYLLVIFSFCSTLPSDVISYCDFEDNWSCPWLTAAVKFTTKKASDISHLGYPDKDASLGSSEGHYLLAVRKNGSDIHQTTVMLISPCYKVTELVCGIRFKAVVSGSSQKEKLKVYISKYCDGEDELSKASDTTSHLVGPLSPPGPLTDTNGSWFEERINISKLSITTSYQIVLVAEVPFNDSFIAIDSLSLESCPTACPAGEFLCGRGECIPEEKLCDLQKDCKKGEDEKNSICDKLPYFASSSFDKCDIHDGTCGWVNSPRTNREWLQETKKSKNWLSSERPGGFVYVNKTDKKKKAILHSAVHPRPVNQTGTCQIRFFYMVSDIILSSLKLEWRKPCYNTSARHLWDVSEENEVLPLKWYQKIIDLPIDSSFTLQFTADVRVQMGTGIAVALDDITFSPNCYSKLPGFKRKHANQLEKIFESSYSCGPDFLFTSCGALGQKGPSQQQCDQEYKNSERNISVSVGDRNIQGVQIWTVPETGSYSITAVGASGGLGLESGTELSRGGYVHGKFNFQAGDQLYLLIGQQGESACLQAGFESESYCSLRIDNGTDKNLVSQSGGGGGGGTYVYQRRDGKIQELIVAGGGAGLGHFQHTDVKLLAGGIEINGIGRTGISTNFSGAGGGLIGEATSPMSGRSLTDGSVGGRGCLHSSNNRKWSVNGGFGGGGGACRNGGGGGGYSGGNVTESTDNMKSYAGGSSYAHPDASDVLINAGINAKGGGYVEIIQILDCPCELMCMWTDFDNNEFHCLCPLNSTLSSDGHSCIAQRPARIQSADVHVITLGHIIVIALSCFAIMVLFLAMITYYYHRRRMNDKTRLSKIQRAMSPSITMGGRGFHVHQQTVLPSILMLNNPSYSMVQPESSEPILTEISRKNLSLLSLLGQGAFGEVYQGLITGPPFETETSVAVKILPALSTEQAELDFLMEAVIISKFKHPNIVGFIGVCFEKHPRFIILELLQGGDVRSFLRESRPKPSQPSQLKVLDLLKLAFDIAKGCQHLEEKHFIHRDIAARNCLLTTKGPDRVAKIADFGLARDIYSSDYYKKAGKAMLPVKWMPPEAFLDGMFSSKTDVWSFGILLWEIFALGHVPYPGCANEEVMHFVTVGGRLEPPESCPAAVFDIMASCWSGLAEERPTFDLIITSLEKSMQDDDVALRGLPVFYIPPLLGSHRSFMPLTNYVTPYQTSLCAPCEYLEPLIPAVTTTTTTTITSHSISPSLEYRDSGHPCNDAMHSSGNLSQFDEMGADSVFEDSAVDVQLCKDEEDNFNGDNSLQVSSLLQLSSSSPASVGFLASARGGESVKYSDIIPLNNLQMSSGTKCNNGSLPFTDVIVNKTKS